MCLQMAMSHAVLQCFSFIINIRIFIRFYSALLYSGYYSMRGYHPRITTFTAAPKYVDLIPRYNAISGNTNRLLVNNQQQYRYVPPTLRRGSYKNVLYFHPPNKCARPQMPSAAQSRPCIMQNPLYRQASCGIPYGIKPQRIDRASTLCLVLAFASDGYRR